MTTPARIILYSFLFVFIGLGIRFLGIVNFSSEAIFAFALMFLGLSLFYTYFGTFQHSKLFLSSTTFLLGVLLYLDKNIQGLEIKNLIIPILIFIPGINFLLLYLEDNSKRTYLILSVVFLFLIIALGIFRGTLSIETFFTSFIGIVTAGWATFLFLIMLVVLFFGKEQDI